MQPVSGSITLSRARRCWSSTFGKRWKSDIGTHADVRTYITALPRNLLFWSLEVPPYRGRLTIPSRSRFAATRSEVPNPSVKRS
jgi:hypothetical protein